MRGVVYGALNATGQLAGTTQAVDGTGATVRTVVLRQPDGTLTTLAAPTLPPTLGSRLQVRGLSASGRMALQYSNGLDGFGPVCGDYLGWLGNGASAAGWQALGAAGTVLSLAGINGGGVAVGSAVPAASCGGVGNGFRAVASGANGALLNLHGALPGVFSHATGINDLGYAVGDYDSGARTAPDAYNPLGVPIARAVVWNTASLQPTDLGVPGASSRLNAVNNRGEVVGRATGPMAAGQPLAGASTWAVLGNLATGAPLVNLNTLLSQNTGGWVLQEALAINRSGQIVARGSGTAGSGFVLLTPVSAPADPYATVPVAPASLAVSAVTATSARLGWTLAARNATRVVVERCTGSRCTNFAAVATLAGDATGYSNTSLARRTAYRWRGARRQCRRPVGPQQPGQHHHAALITWGWSAGLICWAGLTWPGSAPSAPSALATAPAVEAEEKGRSEVVGRPVRPLQRLQHRALSSGGAKVWMKSNT